MHPTRSEWRRFALVRRSGARALTGGHWVWMRWESFPHRCLPAVTQAPASGPASSG